MTSGPLIRPRHIFGRESLERYIKRMMRKAGASVISADDGKAIYEFLTYDSKTRKKALFDKKTAEAKEQK